jgi:hypothetical protein
MWRSVTYDTYDKVFLECEIRTAMPSSDDAMSTRMATTGSAQPYTVLWLVILMLYLVVKFKMSK